MRRKTKWTLGILLSLVLLVELMLGTSATVYADGNIARIGDTEYATFAEAVSGASDGATITLLKDCEHPWSDYGDSIVSDVNYVHLKMTL